MEIKFWFYVFVGAILSLAAFIALERALYPSKRQKFVMCKEHLFEGKGCGFLTGDSISRRDGVCDESWQVGTAYKDATFCDTFYKVSREAYSNLKIGDPDSLIKIFNQRDGTFDILCPESIK